MAHMNLSTEKKIMDMDIYGTNEPFHRKENHAKGEGEGVGWTGIGG